LRCGEDQPHQRDGDYVCRTNEIAQRLEKYEGLCDTHPVKFSLVYDDIQWFRWNRVLDPSWCSKIELFPKMEEN
jgi:hypothetical protein